MESSIEKDKKQLIEKIVLKVFTPGRNYIEDKVIIGEGELKDIME